MIGIERVPDLTLRIPAEEGKYRLVYSKSKVYVSPTAYTRDDMPQFCIS
jgi:hypothetical protein